jgi:hypothetical protein
MASMQDGLAPREDPVRLRDAALNRISLTRRWLIVAAAGLTAGLAALVSALLPGKSLGAKSTAAHAAAAASSTPALPAPASAAQLGIGSSASTPSISPPPAAPQAAPAPAPSAPAPAPSGGGGAVSGGS